MARQSSRHVVDEGLVCHIVLLNATASISGSHAKTWLRSKRLPNDDPSAPRNRVADHLRPDRSPPFPTYRRPPGITARASSFPSTTQKPATRRDWHSVPASLPGPACLGHPSLCVGFRTICATKIARDIARPGQFAILPCRGQRTAIRTWSLGQRGANSETDPCWVGFCFSGRVSPRQSAISEQAAIES